MKRMISAITFAALTVILPLYSCAPRELILEDVHSEKKPDIKKIPPIRGAITEVELAGGVQKFVYIKLGSLDGVYSGLVGYVYNASDPGKRVAKFRVNEIYTNYLRGQIIELNYTIDQGASVVIEIDPKFLYN